MSVLTLLPFVMACALSDLITRRIPNTLILCGLSGALLSRFHLMIQRVFSTAGTLSPGPDALPVFSVLADGFAGFLLPWLLFGALAVLKMIGGGDVKLLSVIGLYLGAKSTLTVIWYTLLTAAVWSVAIVIRRRNLSQRLGYLYRYIGQTMISAQARPYRSQADSFGEASLAAGKSGLADGRNACRRGGTQGGENDSGEFCLALPVLLALSLFLCDF